MVDKFDDLKTSRLNFFLIINHINIEVIGFNICLKIKLKY